MMRESAALAVELDRNPTSPWRTLALTALGFSLYLSGERLYLSGEPGAAEVVGRAVQVEASPPLVLLAALSAAPANWGSCGAHAGLHPARGGDSAPIPYEGCGGMRFVLGG